ncbi:MAG: hypothetical protein IJA69_01345 [Clostridia bacterium]|nr:hypothetical protein [Clostridia bacterium]
MNTKKINKSYEKCNSCGGNLKYSPQDFSLKCTKCGALEKIETTKTFQKHNYFKNSENAEEYKKFKTSQKAFECASCGAKVVLGNLEISATCPYCHSSFAIENTEKIGLVPDAILPFTYSNEQAGLLYKQNIKKKWFLPNKIKKNVPTENIFGIYVPSFSFDQKTYSAYEGVLEEDYEDSDGETHTRSFSIGGNHNADFYDVLVETSSHINLKEFEQIKPYDLSKIVDYKSQFILGYSVEHYADALNDCKKIGDELIDGYIKNQILSNYSYDRVRWLKINTLRTEEKYAYYVLPVYKLDINHKNKIYSTYMNGQTAKLGGKFPRSALKITSLVLAIVSVILAFVLWGVLS